MDHLATIKEYLAAIESGATNEVLEKYYAVDVQQIEYPNRLVPKGVTRTLNDLKQGAVIGASIQVSQKFELQNAIVQGNTAMIEAIWTGTFKMQIGTLKPGDEMKAYFAQFFEFNEEGKIVRQRNYDCFEPF